jgi:hypothetical protein
LQQNKFTCFWLQKSKQQLGFFQSPLFILLDIKYSNVVFIYLRWTIQVMSPFGRYYPNRLEAAPADHMVILRCGVYTSRLTRYIPTMFGSTYWSHGDPYMCGHTTSKVIENIDFMLAFCWVFILATLLLKQISMIVMLDTMFQHVLGIFTRCWM